MKIQFHRIDTNGRRTAVREFCCSGTDVSAKVLAMYADTGEPVNGTPVARRWVKSIKLLNQVLSRAKANI